MLPEILLIQAEARSGESPMRTPGAISSSTHAVMSRGKLISETRLPAKESSERRLGLEASSSTSPRRGSMSGFMRRRRRDTKRRDGWGISGHSLFYLTRFHIAEMRDWGGFAAECPNVSDRRRP